MFCPFIAASDHNYLYRSRIDIYSLHKFQLLGRSFAKTAFVGGNFKGVIQDFFYSRSVLDFKVLSHKNLKILFFIAH